LIIAFIYHHHICLFTREDTTQHNHIIKTQVI